MTETSNIGNIDNDILKHLPHIVENKNKWIPAYIYKNNPEILLEHASANELDSLMIILPNGADISDKKLTSFLENKKSKIYRLREFRCAFCKSLFIKTR